MVLGFFRLAKNSFQVFWVFLSLEKIPKWNDFIHSDVNVFELLSIEMVYSGRNAQIFYQNMIWSIKNTYVKLEWTYGALCEFLHFINRDGLYWGKHLKKVWSESQWYSTTLNMWSLRYWSCKKGDSCFLKKKLKNVKPFQIATITTNL